MVGAKSEGSSGHGSPDQSDRLAVYARNQLDNDEEKGKMVEEIFANPDNKFADEDPAQAYNNALDETERRLGR